MLRQTSVLGEWFSYTLSIPIFIRQKRESPVHNHQMLSRYPLVPSGVQRASNICP